MASDRNELSRAQAALLRALVADGEAPAGFDPGRLHAARESLHKKRLRELTRAWPSLAGELSRDPSRVPSLPEGGGLVAGYLLARARLARGELGPDAFRELCAFELRWRVKNGAATRRRGPAVRLWRRRGPTPGTRWVLALKTPWGAERWWGSR